ncbi:MAG: ABC transporter permease [Sphingobacteriales bacterium JAD_PAG50586_3]|nr:MAG: ABC transporter permease [Sphingobacteriales bacterium JAD_PAG50586_3]
MGKISLIIKREYITRVRKPAFIIMTILGPLLFGLITVAPVLLAQVSDEEKVIAVSDVSMLYFSALKEKETEKIKFVYLPPNLLTQTLKDLDKSNYYAVLDIPVTMQGDYNQIKKHTKIYSIKNVGLGVQSHIENVLTEEIRSRQLETSGIDKALVDKTLQRVNIKPIEVGEDGKQKQKSAELNMAVGLTFGFLIYIFIFLYGAMVMRGVIEEKTSRIVEVIVSSVKPFQLMMGKIIGVGMVGLTQFVIWVVLGIGITIGAQSMVADKYDSQQVAQQATQAQGLDQGQIDEMDSKVESAGAMEQILGLPFGKLIFCFLFYFLGGYLLYGSFFAAIGGAVDSETDSQQFMLPVTIPIIFAIVMMQFVLNNPDGPVAFWLSMVPLTSPIIMMVRVPFDPPMWQIAVSMVALVLTFILSTWLAGRVYRTGILMYGKKASWKELGKWLFYKG